MFRNAFPVVATCLTLCLACGGSKGTTSTPTTPTPTQANRAPTINSMTFSPSFGIANLTTFNYASSASDPDGDTLSYRWDIAGTAYTTASGPVIFTSGGNEIATLTVTDGKGGTTSDSRTFVVGSMTGVWTGNVDTFPMRMVLSQPAGGVVTGTFLLTPFTGQLDPAGDNKIEANGHFVLRCKVTSGPTGSRGVSDFTLDGSMDTTGVRLTGGVRGSGFGGQPFVLTK